MAPCVRAVKLGRQTICLVALWTLYCSGQWAFCSLGRSTLGQECLHGSRKRCLSVVARAAGDDLGPGGTTPLMLASNLGDLEEVLKLIKDGADIDTQDKYGWTALRYAVRGDRYVVAEALIDAGADLNKPSSSGRTPLMSAAANGLDDMVRLLVKSGADLALKNKDGMTAYDLALRGGPTGSDMIREMVKV
eukprot:CAMPEP_0178444764 /NCGR_PEP_ID=MMETSP0689_2-20121128/39729_1 /TAXON_ID=160604 /ORGANISM="Amphidinium massartii, Strain CS-259" /LENGTH=190 /DNA_ID=CAMNT_0020069113 /DNA_START=50 /DNA_END=622 /DNA_ORIENTATION=+